MIEGWATAALELHCRSDNNVMSLPKGDLRQSESSTVLYHFDFINGIH